jgi:hypothetical protein
MGADRATLLDIAKQTDPDGKPAMVIEILNQKNPILQDAPAYPSNAQMGNRVTLRSALPTVGFSKVNKGVVRSKGGTEQKIDTIGLIAGLSEVDSKLRKIVGDGAFNAARMNEDRGFIESMTQLVALTTLYGDEKTNAASFTGLAPRMGATASAITGSQVWSMGSVSGGDGTSMYIVDWGRDSVHLIYPRDGAGVAGVDVQDKGELRVTDVDGNPMMAFVTAYDWLVGLTVKDPRHIARLANIDVSDANVASPSQGKLIPALIDVLANMPDPAGSRRVIYCARRLWAAFWKQAIDKANAALSMSDYLNQPTPHFLGYPIRTLDQISMAESTVS